MFDDPSLHDDDGLGLFCLVSGIVALFALIGGLYWMAGT